MITLTEKAAEEIGKVIEQHQQNRVEESGGVATAVKPLYLRVGVMGGGCSGFKQSLDLTETVSDGDERFEQHGVTVVCDPKSHIYLDGATIDFKTTTMGSGFVFEIPMASGRCGCGSSFSV